MIRDSRLRPESAAPAERPLSGGTRRETAMYAPLLALEYSVDGRPMVSTGFDTGSRVSVGGIGGAVAEFSRWPPNSTVPCWFDPEHPEDVVVLRGFGGAYLFALFPLPLFLFGAWAVVNGRRRARQGALTLNSLALTIVATRTDRKVFAKTDMARAIRRRSTQPRTTRVAGARWRHQVT